MNWTRTLAVTLAPLLAATAVAAQEPFRKIRGEVVELVPSRIAVRQANGEVFAMRLIPDWTVQVFRPIKLTDIPAGAFVGVVETPEGGAGRAHEVHRFEPGVRMGEGRQPWDRPAGSTLTSGEIGPVTKTAAGYAFEVTFQGGKRQIVASDATPVVLIDNESREHIKVGVKAFILAWPEANGVWRVDAVATGPDGSLPPL